MCTDQRIKCAVEQFVQSKPTEARGCRGDAVAASTDHHCVHYNGGHSQSTSFRLITVFAEDWPQIGFPGNKLWDCPILKETLCLTANGVIFEGRLPGRCPFLSKILQNILHSHILLF